MRVCVVWDLRMYACPVVCVQNCIGETTQCFLVAALYN